MAKNLSILVAVRALSHKGKRLIGDSWLKFLYGLRTYLQHTGAEDKESSDELLLFTYTHPYNAFSSLFESLEKIKSELNWKESLGPVPIQIIFHLEEPGEISSRIREISSDIWDMLQMEFPYVSRPLKNRWDQLMAEKKLPPHFFESEGEGFFRLEIKDKSSIRRENLFPCRDLVLRGGKAECFYCGMTNHEPQSCPGKFLTMEMNGLDDAGYLPFDTLTRVFRQIFSDPARIRKILSSGVSPSQIRKDPALQVFIAYFDLFRIYQPRFLWHMAFTTYSGWDAVFRTDKMNIDSRTLHMGLDCLRVGQYVQAEKFFKKELNKNGGKKFYAAIGQAFSSLELGRERDFQNFLEKAKNMADSDQKQTYINLLLSRFYDLSGSLWRGSESVGEILNKHPGCFEANYRKIQINVKEGHGENMFNSLQSLTLDNREYFMIALMDPMLMQIHGMTEDMLSARFDGLKGNAGENLAIARSACDELKLWVGKTDRSVQANFQTLANLVKQYDRKSYYDIHDVAEKSKALTFACQRIMNEKIQELKEKVDSVISRWVKYDNYWKAYPFKSMFKPFINGLIGARKKLTHARDLVGTNKPESCERAEGLLDVAIHELDEIKPIYFRMARVLMFLKGARIFVSKLIITEVVLGLIGITLFFVLNRFLTATVPGEIVKLLSDPWFQKQSLFFGTLFIAPLVALGLTVRGLNKS
ncbi:MAG: hypothetical protein U9O82_08625 [Thermodesulfobacteriota bacterium]|nr:hypothetical protein [Thermodesulfobacteriota bacterium]